MEDPLGKNKQQDNPFIEPSQQNAVVDMKGQKLNLYLDADVPVQHYCCLEYNFLC